MELSPWRLGVLVVLPIVLAACGGGGNGPAAPAPTATATMTQSPTHSPTHTQTQKPTPTFSPRATATAIPTATSTVSPTSTSTVSPTATLTLTITPTVADSPTPTATATIGSGRFCDLPGSVQTTEQGLVVVPGGPPNTADLNFLVLPSGFCAHFFARVGNPRQLRFAPSGELFVASPTTASTGGGPGGQAAILVLPDDNLDGMADTTITFLSRLPSTQGLLFAPGYLYYQDRITIMRLPYAAGDREAAGVGEEVANISVYTSALHWPKSLDMADDGTIYVGNGGDQFESCDPAHPFRGGILKLDGTPGGAQVAKGFRNPIAVRCLRWRNRCFTVELARDFSAAIGGREKVVPIHQGDDWGFPCCATKDSPFPDIFPRPDCSAVVPEDASFYIGNTPFDLDFETGKWPQPWTNRVFVPLHGAYGNWAGARLVTLEIDAATGDLLPGSDLEGMSSGAMRDFATGWADGTLRHGRPANVAFAPDGRLFLSHDTNGNIIWIAPLDLPLTAP